MPVSAGLGRFAATLRTRSALGLGPGLTPVMLFVPVGILLGPWGTGALSPRVIAVLDVVVSVALGTIGVFVGIAVGSNRENGGRLLVAATTQCVVTFAVVGGALFWLLQAWGLPLAFPAVLAAGALGLAAAPSAAPFIEDGAHDAYRIAGRIADLDDVFPIVVGSILLSMATPNATGIGSDLLLTLAVGLGVGLSGWLLFEKAEGAERGVFVVGTLILLGGAAAYAGTSPLTAGMVAGFVWALTPGHTDRIAAADLRKIEHPLVVLLLIVAGSGLEPSLTGVWLLAPYVLFRTTGKLLGGWFASRVAPKVTPSDLGAYLIAPGVLGLGFILNLQQVAPEAARPLVFAVAIGAVISELMAVAVTPEPARP